MSIFIEIPNILKPVLIINSAEEKVREFVVPLVSYLENWHYSYSIAEWKMIPSLSELNTYAAIIISGSPRGDNANFKERVNAFKWLLNIEVPVFGICAGHQLMGFIYGGELIGNREAEEGINEVEICQSDPVFDGLPSSITVEQHHNDSITLPEEFILLAKSDKCMVQAMKHRSKELITVQWHAELSNPEIIRNFLKHHVGDFDIKQSSV